MRHTDASRIPSQWLDQARAVVRIGYSHTSHGSQLVTGLEALRELDGARFAFARSNWGLAPGVFLNDGWANQWAGDLGHAVIEPLSAGCRVWAYGSVVDNVTGDPTTVPVLLP